MKPKPLVALNHFTVPEAMVCILESSSLTMRGECASGQCAFGPAESTLSTGPVCEPSRAPGGLRACCRGAIWTSRHLARPATDAWCGSLDTTNGNPTDRSTKTERPHRIHVLDGDRGQHECQHASRQRLV